MPRKPKHPATAKPKRPVQPQPPKVGPWRFGKSAASRAVHGRATGKR